MRGFILGLLYSIEFLGSVVAGGALAYRAVLFSSYSSATVWAVVGVLMALASVYKMLAMLHQAAEHAAEEREGVLWKDPFVLVVGAMVSSFVALRLAGLEISGFVKWIGYQVGQWLA